MPTPLVRRAGWSLLTLACSLKYASAHSFECVCFDGAMLHMVSLLAGYLPVGGHENKPAFATSISLIVEKGGTATKRSQSAHAGEEEKTTLVMPGPACTVSV